MDEPLHCCFAEPDCPKGAEFEIRDVADPDPYSCIIHSCADHVGALLGHAVDAPRILDLWEVRAL